MTLENKVIELIEQRTQLAAHLLKVMEVALDNMEYAPSSDAAGEQFDTLVKARDYLVAQGFVKLGALI